MKNTKQKIDYTLNYLESKYQDDKISFSSYSIIRFNIINLIDVISYSKINELIEVINDYHVIPIIRNELLRRVNKIKETFDSEYYEIDNNDICEL